jgi:dTDP-glucose 4,6-dehydratase
MGIDMKKVLICGGAGFIGSNYTHFHVEKYPEEKVFVLDKLTYAGHLENLEGLEKRNFAFVQGDIADKKFVEDLFEKEKFDLVINFAAETHVDRSILNPSLFVMTNIVGTQNLLDASRDTGVSRYHQISTDEVYGDLGDTKGTFFVETTPLEPNCPYAASKAAADLLVLSAYKTYEFPATVSRCSNNYGPYQYPEKLIPYFFNLAKAGKKLPVYGDGLNVRDWLYVSDHCTAIDLIVRNGKLGDAYNIGGHNEKTNLEITYAILDFLGKDRNLIEYVEDRLAHDRRYAMNPTKIANELAWEPEIDLEKGLKMTFDWYEKNANWVQKVTSKH